MAIYKSNGYIKNARLRPDSQVEPAEASFTVTVPAGTGVADNDLFYFCKIGEGVDIISVDMTVDPLDSNPTAAVRGSLGVVPATTAKTITAVETLTGQYDSIFDNVILNVNAGVAKNIQRFAGGGTGDIFNVNPYPIKTAVGDLVLSLDASPNTPITAGQKNITVRVKYQYAYPGRLIVGVSDSTYPWAGSITYGDPIQYTYGAGQDGTPNAP